MIGLDPHRLAREAEAEIVRRGSDSLAARAVIDSRLVAEGDLFFGIAGDRDDGGEYAAEALERGAWGVVVRPDRVGALASANGWVLGSSDPLRSLGKLARAWRRELGCAVVGVTGSTGKTSVKDIAAGLLPGMIHASPGNYNTETGLPMAILEAEAGTETLVLEMSMRGAGEIALLCEIAEPDVGVITNVGPAHLELLGSVAAIAAAKAEILDGIVQGGRAVIPSEPGPLAPYLTAAVATIRFGAGGDVSVVEATAAAGATEATIATPVGEGRFRFPFTEAHNLVNALCAVAIGVSLEVPVDELCRRAPGIVLSRLRGERIELADGVVVINDSYNANPVSMRAALENLRAHPASGRRVAVLGDMYELGPDAATFHRVAGEHARELGIDSVIGVGELARDYRPDEWVSTPEQAAEIASEAISAGDLVLVKGSRGIGLDRFAERLAADRGLAER